MANYIDSHQVVTTFMTHHPTLCVAAYTDQVGRMLERMFKTSKDT